MEGKRTLVTGEEASSGAEMRLSAPMVIRHYRGRESLRRIAWACSSKPLAKVFLTAV
jgi:hypothetical protein